MTHQKRRETFRHQCISDTVATAQEMLAEPAVQDAMEDTVTSFDEILSQLYAPEISDHHLVVPAIHQNNRSLAITALYRRERLVAEGVINELHERQENELIDFMDEYSGAETLDAAERADAIAHVNQGLRDYKGTVVIRRNVSAQVMEADYPLVFHSVHKTGETKKVISGKPFVAFAISNKRSIYTYSMTLLHETRHLEQTLKNSVLDTSRFEPDLLLSAELQAYNTQALIMRALYHYSKNKRFYHNSQIINPTAAHVEAIRQAVNTDPDNPFAASSAIKATLKKEGIAIVLK